MPASKPLPSGSGPRPASSRCASSARVGQRSTAPKRRASLRVTRAPPSMSRTTWSCFSGAGCGWWKAPTCAPETRSRPDIPRCTISVSPRSSAASRYLDRRRSALDPRPVSRSARRGGNGQRRSGRRTSAAAMTPAGQHRLEAAAHRLDLGQLGQGAPPRPARGCGAPDLPYKERRNRPKARAADGRRAHHPFRLRDRARGREGAARARRLRLGRRALRPDERRDEPRHPPAVEGRDARLAGAAARHAARSTSPAAPATSPSASCGRRQGPTATPPSST